MQKRKSRQTLSFSFSRNHERGKSCTYNFNVSRENNLQLPLRFRTRRRRRNSLNLVCTRWEINIRAIKGGKFEELIRASSSASKYGWHLIKRTNERKKGRKKESLTREERWRNVTSERETSTTAEADVNSNVNFVPAQSHGWVGIINLNINISRPVNHVRVTPKRNDWPTMTILLSSPLSP